ncbi:MTH1187 family thiamine-binding protein [Chloroflexota bacterium]
MAIIDVGVIPLGTETPSVSKYVAGAVRLLENEKDIKYELTAMGTIIEGDLPNLLSLAQKMHDSAFDAGAMRVVTIIKIDERRDQVATISSKTETVNRELGR